MYPIKWTYLTIEPILGSGEFINVGILVLHLDSIEYFPILDARKSNYLFGSNGQQLSRNIEYAISAIRKAESSKIDEICLPLTGSKLGFFRNAFVEDIQNFVKTLKEYSLFGHSGFEKTIAYNSREITREKFLAKFVQEVRNDLVVVSKNYSKLFNVEYNLPTVSSPVKYGFSTKNYVANFSYIHPGPNITVLMKNTTYKLLELGLINQAKIKEKPFEYELILHAPTIFIPKSQDEERFSKEIEKLHLFAKDNGIGVFGTQEVKGTVSHLISKIVA